MGVGRNACDGHSEPSLGNSGSLHAFNCPFLTAVRVVCNEEVWGKKEAFSQKLPGQKKPGGQKLPVLRAWPGLELALSNSELAAPSILAMP